MHSPSPSRTRLGATFLAATVIVAGLTGEVRGQAYHWGNVAMGGGGFVSAVIASPLEKNLFYARTDVGGSYRWEEASKTWVPLMDWVDITERGLLGIEAIAVDPKTPGKVYMVAGTVYWNQATDGIGRSAFLRSKDYGKTWEKIYTWDDNTKWFSAHGNGMGRGNGEALAIDPGNPDVMFYGSKNKGLWKSIDNGSTWKHVDAFTTVAGSDTTWNGAGFSFVQYAPGSSTTLYAGFLRERTNVFQSTDGGTTWKGLPIPDVLRTTSGGKLVRLMPQRLATTSPDTALFITFSDGAGPHTMAWDDGWGMIHDGFGRGAVLKYSANTGSWTDISPEDCIDEGGVAKYDNLDVAGALLDKTKYEYIAPYGGVTINPSNPLEMVVSTEGYRGAQFWKLDATGKAWKDQWGTNLYHTVDGGKSWVASFKYYWMEGGIYPAAEQMNANGIGWMFSSSIHWSGSVAFDPYNPKRVFVTSGNGMFYTDDITDYTYTPPVNSWDGPVIEQRQVWKVASHGIEETVPLDLVSVPGGPVVSVIGDYDGFRHDDIAKYPGFRHRTNVNGTAMSLGTTRALAYAPLSGRLVKVSDARSANPTTYTDVGISPLQFSSDTGRTWTVETYPSLDTSWRGATSVALSADGKVALWTPLKKKTGITEKDGEWPVFRHDGNAFSSVAGIDGAYLVGDPADADVFYAYLRSTGEMFRSQDKGATFAKVGEPGKSEFRKFRTAPGAKGDLWLPIAASADTGRLLRTKDGGATWAAVTGIGRCEAVGFGKAAAGKTFPAVYIYATVAGKTGIYQSIDEGASWVRVNDDAHEYGGLANGEFVVGDMNTFGVVYMSTAGRGIAARLAGADSNAGVGAGKSAMGTLAQAKVRNQGRFLSVSGAPAGTRIEIRTISGALVGAGEVKEGSRFALPSHSVFAVRLMRATESVRFLR